MFKLGKIIKQNAFVQIHLWLYLPVRNTHTLRIQSGLNHKIPYNAEMLDQDEHPIVFVRSIGDDEKLPVTASNLHLPCHPSRPR